MIIYCQFCGKEFFCQRKDKKRISKFCSNDCVRTYRKQNIKGEINNCIVCQKIFYVMPYNIKKKFCSIQCKNIGLKKIRILNKCAYCNIEYYNKVSGKNKKFCSKNCYSKYRFGKNATNYRHGIYINDYYGNGRSNKSKIWSLAIKKRDGFACLLCGTGNTIISHHIYPFSKHENLRYDLKNGITLCGRCHKFTLHQEYLYISILRNVLHLKYGYIND